MAIVLGGGAGFAPTRVITPPTTSPFAGQVARNTGTGADAAIGRSLGAPPSTFSPSPASLATAMTPQQQRMAELMSDPGYASASNAALRNANDASSQRQAAIRAAALKFGGLPQGFVDRYGDVDQATLDAASANPYSDTAMENRQFGQAQSADRQALAARGASDSGATPGIIGKENFQYGLDLNNIGNQFGSSIGSALSDYTGALNTNANNLSDATFKAEQAQQTNPAYMTTAAPRVITHPVTGQRITIPQNVSGTFTPAQSRVNPFIARNARNAI